MKLFTRLAITIFIATLFPLILILMMLTGQISYEMMNVLHILLGLILLYGIRRSIVRPLKQLKNAVNRVKEGDLEFSIHGTRDDEIGELTEDFEAMRIRLRNNALEKSANEEATRVLIANIAHDLKTPITTIRGYAEGILDGVAETPEMQQKYIQTIYHKANDMAMLIEELTFYAKMEANSIPYSFMKLPARGFFEDNADEIAIDMEAKGIGFRFSCDVAPEICIKADPEQLHKVINNIVNNSVKYIDKEQKVIDMHVYEVGSQVRCDMWDNGSGVRKEELEQIFERFYRTDKSRSTKGGSGIGLSIVKKIIEDHGGEVWATCEPGSGLAMHFLLKKYTEDEADEENSDS